MQQVYQEPPSGRLRRGQVLAEGKNEKARDAAIGLYENGVSVEIIAKSLKLSEEKVREIIEQKIPEKA